MSEPVIVSAQTTTAILPSEKVGGPAPPPALDRLLLATSEASPGPFVRQLQSLLEASPPAATEGYPGLEEGKAWEAAPNPASVARFEAGSGVSVPELSRRESYPQPFDVLPPDAVDNGMVRVPAISAEVSLALAERQGKKGAIEPQAFCSVTVPTPRPERLVPTCRQPADKGPQHPMLLEAPSTEQAACPQEEVGEEDPSELWMGAALQPPIPQPAVEMQPAPGGQAQADSVGETKEARPIPSLARVQEFAGSQDRETALEAPSRLAAPAMVPVPSVVETSSIEGTPAELQRSEPKVVPAVAEESNPSQVPMEPGNHPSRRFTELAGDKYPPAQVAAPARQVGLSKDAPPAEATDLKPALPLCPSLPSEGNPSGDVALPRPRVVAAPVRREPEDDATTAPTDSERGTSLPERPLAPAFPGLEAQAETSSPKASRVGIAQPGAEGDLPKRPAPGAAEAMPKRSAPGAAEAKPERSAPGAAEAMPERSAPGAAEAMPRSTAPGAAEAEAAAFASGKKGARVAQAVEQVSPAPAPGPEPGVLRALRESPTLRSAMPLSEAPSPSDFEGAKAATVAPRLLANLDIQADLEVPVPDAPLGFPLRLEHLGPEVLVPQTLWIRQVENEIARVFQIERLAVSEPTKTSNELAALDPTTLTLLEGEAREKNGFAPQAEARGASSVSQGSADSEMESTAVSAASSPRPERPPAQAPQQPGLPMTDAMEVEPSLSSAGKALVEARQAGVGELPGGERPLETLPTPAASTPVELTLEDETVAEVPEMDVEAVVTEAGQTGGKSPATSATREWESAPALPDPRLPDGQEQRLIRRYQMRQALQSEKHLDLHFHSERLGEVSASLDIQKSGQWTASLQLGEPAAEPGIVRQLERIQEHPLSEGHQLTSFSTGLMHSGQGQGERSKQRTLSPTKGSRTPKFSEELPIDSLGGQELKPRSGINLRA